MSCVGPFVLKIINILVLFILKETATELSCDNKTHEHFPEGNIGQTGLLPWLGVIRAHVFMGAVIRIAVTGAILIKPKYALASADDMAKIRKGGDSKAMFISRDRHTWTCKLGEVAVHPEYDFATYSTVAVVELDTDSISGSGLMMPICPPTYMYNTSNELYALGFTDENKLLEKTAYKVQYIERELCDEYYKRAGRQKGMFTPDSYECAFAVNLQKECEWENGMALVSNTSGYWVLIGISVQGPGCSAPARFIDVYSYMHWIKSSTDEDVNADSFKVVVRRSGQEILDKADDTHFNVTNNLHQGNDTYVNVTNYLNREKPIDITFRQFLSEREFVNSSKSLVIGIEDNKTLD